MSDPVYQPDPVGGLVRDALMRFPNNKVKMIDYIVRHGPATLEAATQLAHEALRENVRPTSDDVGWSDDHK